MILPASVSRSRALPLCRAFSVTVVASIILFTTAVTASSDFHRLSLAGTTYCVPERLDLLDQTSGAAFSITGSDQGNGRFQVAVPAEKVQQTLPDYAPVEGDMPTTLFIALEAAPGERIRRTQDAAFHGNKLKLEGEYAGAATEPSVVPEFHRVTLYGIPNPPIWHVLNQAPEKALSLPDSLHDYHVAYCGRSGKRSSSCDFTISHGDKVLLEVTTSESNLALKPQLIRFAEDLLFQWKANCNE